MTQFTKKKIEEDKLVEEELGSLGLRARISRFIRGGNNFSRMGKSAAAHRARVELAKQLRKRKEDGTRERNRKRGTSSSKSGANQT